MQRFLLLILSITLAVIIFVCSRQGGEHSPRNSGSNIEVQTIQPFYYVALFHRGPYTDHENVISQFFTETAKQKILATGPMMGLYFNDPAENAPGDLEWAIGLPVKDSLIVKKPLKLIKWNNPEVLVYTHYGPTDSTAYVYKMFDAYMKKYQLAPAGPAVERFLFHGDRDSSVTEIWFPVQSAGGE